MQVEAEYKALATKLENEFPNLQFEVFEDLENAGDYFIAVLSSGPDYAPDVAAALPIGWEFSGWKNRDQRNNIGSIVKLEEV